MVTRWNQRGGVWLGTYTRWRKAWTPQALGALFWQIRGLVRFINERKSKSRESFRPLLSYCVLKKRGVVGRNVVDLKLLVKTPEHDNSLRKELSYQR
jgi:hypothetical protein